MLPDDLRGQRIGIFGFGINNRALTAWLVRHGAESLTVFDERPDIESEVQTLGLDVSVKSGPGAFERAHDLDVIFRTPGLHPDHPVLKQLREQGVRITSQTDLFLQLCPARTVGITGTKGKGTTSALLAYLLNAKRPPAGEAGKTQNAKPNVYLAGNIGTDPFEFLDELQPDDTVILELSSAQLADVQRSPNLAIVLDVSADHLDYHADLTEYLKAKQAIVRYQGAGDVALLNLDSAASREFSLVAGGTVLYYSTTKSVDAGGYIVGEQIYYRDPRDQTAAEIATTDELPLRGTHNRTNALAAITAALMLGVQPSDLRGQLQSFSGLPHRLETMATKRGVMWVNDSFATVPQATIQAIQSFDEPLLLIVGGSGKGLAWDDLAAAIATRHLKCLLTIGATGPEIARIAQAAGFPADRVIAAEDLPTAVAEASNHVKPGDVVLLSPASASFDQFRNATERGEQFRALVKALK